MVTKAGQLKYQHHRTHHHLPAVKRPVLCLFPATWSLLHLWSWSPEQHKHPLSSVSCLIQIVHIWIIVTSPWTLTDANWRDERRDFWLINVGKNSPDQRPGHDRHFRLMASNISGVHHLTNSKVTCISLFKMSCHSIKQSAKYFVSLMLTTTMQQCK